MTQSPPSPCGIAPAPQRGNFNPDIHGLRGVAALAVLCFHIYDMSRTQGIVPEDIPFALKAALLSLTSGVDLFFMISGYLITATLLRSGSVRTFAADRVARIYPVFLFLHLLGFCLGPFIHYKWMIDITPTAWMLHFFSNLFFLPGIFKLPLLQLNAWSLSYEALFYAVCAGVYYFWSRQRLVSYLILALIVPPVFYFHPRALFFLTGSAAFFLINRWNLRPQPHRWSALRALAIPLFFVFIGIAYASEHKAPLLALPFGALLFYDLAGGQSALKPLLRHKITQFFGTISYSFYLWHPFVAFPLRMVMAKILIGKLGLGVAPAITTFGVSTFVGTTCIAWLSWRVLEKQVGAWLRLKLEPVEKSTP